MLTDKESWHCLSGVYISVALGSTSHYEADKVVMAHFHNLSFLELFVYWKCSFFILNISVILNRFCGAAAHMVPLVC